MRRSAFLWCLLLVILPWNAFSVQIKSPALDILLPPVSSPQQRVQRIPLTRQQNDNFDLQRLEAFQANHAMLNGVNTNHSDYLDLANYKDVEFSGALAVGSEGRVFQVLFDTGSSDFWIPSASCKGPACRVHRRYNCSTSASCNNTGHHCSIYYGSGGVSGVIVRDEVMIGEHTVHSQQVILVEYEEGETLQQVHFDGIVGMGYPSIAVSSMRPLWDTIFAEHLVENNLFSFYMTRNPDAQGSELILGGYDPSYATEAFTYHRVIDKSYWTISLDKVFVDGAPIVEDTATAIVDTGTTLIYGPSDVVQKILEKAAASDDCSNFKTLPIIELQLGNRKYALAPEEYVFRMRVRSGRVVCLTGIFGTNSNGKARNDRVDWILGSVFIRAYYTVFDRANDQVGFAKAV